MNDHARLRAHLELETEGERSPIIAELERAHEENRRKDVARWSVKACDKVYNEFALLGFVGFVCRCVDGELVFEGVPARVPEFLRDASEEEAA